MEVLTKIIDGWKSLSIFGKIFITMSINQSVSANDYWPWNWTEYGGFPSNPVSRNMVVCPSDTEASKYPYNYMSPIFSVFAFVLLYFFSFSSRIFKHIQHLLIQSQQKSTIKKSEICSKLTIKTSERCLVSFGFFRVRINVNILDREKNGPKPTAGRKHFAFRDAIIVINIWIETINSRWKQSTKHHLFTLQRWSQ